MALYDIMVSVLGNCVAIILPLFYIPFLFPFNCIYNFFSIHHPNCCRDENTPEVHSIKVQKIQDQVRKWNQNGRKRKMCSARNVRKTMATRNIDKSKFTQIQLDEMEDVISIDMEKMIVKVEPGIKMGTLTLILLPLGVTIPVVPEFEALTAGGLINGFGIETSSNKYGLFASTCLEYEVVLADGTVVNCSKDYHSDLFYCIPMSYGTLGFMTSVTFPLVKAGKYVRLQYNPANSISEADALLRRRENFFIEGIAFSKDKSVIMHGNFTDTPERGKINHINRWYKNWFYKHVKSFLNKSVPAVEYIPTRDYYHRHDRSYFWTITIPWLVQTRIYIFLFGWIFPPNYNFLKMTFPVPTSFMNSGARIVMLQDFLVPMPKLEESLTLSDEITGVYPIWLCPCKMFKRPGLVRCLGDTDADYFDIGIYGIMPSKKLKIVGDDATEAVKRFEQFTIANTGLQGFYTDCYLSREDFAKMFDLELYEQLRTEYNCRDAFPEVYEKISIHYRK